MHHLLCCSPYVQELDQRQQGLDKQTFCLFKSKNLDVVLRFLAKDDIDLAIVNDRTVAARSSADRAVSVEQRSHVPGTKADPNNH